MSNYDEMFEKVEEGRKVVFDWLKEKNFECAENANDWFCNWQLLERDDFTDEERDRYNYLKGWIYGVNDVLMAVNGTSLGTCINVETGECISLDNSETLKREMSE